MRSLVEQALRSGVTLHLLTDSKSLFGIISKGLRTIEKLILLDIQYMRQDNCIITKEYLILVSFVQSTI